MDEDTLRKDEAADIASFRELRALLIPRLGAKVVPDETIQRFVEGVFWSSMLYRVPGMPIKVDELLQPIKQGSTSEIVVERRSRMAYVCIDELFSLTGGADSRLAALAAPWLIRRVGLVLGRYVADQPLRGRMPQPASQRKELLYVLNRVVALDAGLETVNVECKPPRPHPPRRCLIRCTDSWGCSAARPAVIETSPFCTASAVYEMRRGCAGRSGAAWSAGESAGAGGQGDGVSRWTGVTLVCAYTVCACVYTCHGCVIRVFIYGSVLFASHVASGSNSARSLQKSGS